MKTCQHTECNYPVFGKGYCKYHQYLRQDKTPKGIVKKERPNKKLDEAYYQLAIILNKKKNGGVCKCEECDTEIKYPTGRNVAHLISKGSNPALYHVIENHFILCYKHQIQFDESGEKHKMKIFEEYERRKESLNSKYYS